MFQIDLRSRKSIYAQVMDNLKEMIVTGEMPADSRVPSVRELSKIISVNPNTVSKAYKELERQGFVYTVTGKGTFVSGPANIKAGSKEIGAAEAALSEAFCQLLYLGLGYEEARKRAERVMDDCAGLVKDGGEDSKGGPIK